MYQLLRASLALFLCLCCIAAGCSGVAVTRQPTKKLEPNYLATLSPPAYDPEHPVVGHAWRNPDGTLATIITYRFETGNGSESQRAAAIRGIGLWNRQPAPAPDFKRLPDEDTTAAIAVRFVDSGPGKTLPAGVQGRATWFPASAPVRGEIYLNRGIVIPSEMVSTAGHEAGHCAFAGDDNPTDTYDRDHSNEPGDLMYFQVQRYIATLTVRDANSLQLAYGAVPSRVAPDSVLPVGGSVDCRMGP
jgi:hypothetical protein